MDIEYVISHWENVRIGLVETINKFRDDELDYRPFAEAWSVRQLMLHIAQEENGEFNHGITQTLTEFPSEYPIAVFSTIAAIQALLESVHAPTLEYLKSMTSKDLKQIVVTPWGANISLIEMIGHLIEHEIHHRAELSLILGLLGRTGFDA